MYIVRETFIAKPGHAGKLAKMMKDEMASMKGFKGYVMLDFVTDYNTIVVEYEVESIAAFGEMMEGYQKEKAEKKKDDTPPEYTQLYQTGKREIFRVL